VTDHLIDPSKPVTVGGKTYTLDGSFKTLKAVQHAFEKDVVDVQVEVYRGMRFDDMARLISVGIAGSGETPPALEAIEQEIVEEIGITETRYLLTEWLVLAMTPKRDREKKARAVAEAIAALRGDSPGTTTGGSA
jgi:hypothetical protein